MHKFAVDGLTIEVSDANHQAIVERAIDKQQKRADEAEKALADAKKAAAEQAAKLDMAEAKVKELTEAQTKADAAVAERVVSMLALGAEVTKLGVDVTKCDHTEVAYKTAAIKKLKPAVVLDGKGVDYINAAYEIAKQDAAQAPSAVDKARAGVDQPRVDAVDNSAEAARRRYNERLFSVAK